MVMLSHISKCPPLALGGWSGPPLAGHHSNFGGQRGKVEEGRCRLTKPADVFNQVWANSTPNPVGASEILTVEYGVISQDQASFSGRSTPPPGGEWVGGQAGRDPEVTPPLGSVKKKPGQDHPRVPREAIAIKPIIKDQQCPPPG